MKKSIAALLIAISVITTLPTPLSDGRGAGAAAPADIPYLHYIAANRQRYIAYRAANPGLPYSKVIAYVNARVDIAAYTDIITVEDPENIAVMLNKNFALPLGYVPPDMVNIGGGRMMRKEAAEHFLSMTSEMNSLGLKLHVVTSYRSYQSQSRNFNNGLARAGRESAERQYARPGHSDHQTGLTVDVLQTSRFTFMTDPKFERTDEYAWLRENAHNYGFILRYPSEYRDIHGYIFEPWHWRYIGVENATLMYNEGIGVFEEFFGKYLAPGIIDRQGDSHQAQQWRSIFE